MADIFQTVKHRTGVGFDEPLHIRERSGRYNSSAVGHAVCLRDWAMLLEFEMERWQSSMAGPFTAYPHGIDLPHGFGFDDHFQAVNYYMPFWGVSNEWIDPSWTPVGEWFDDRYQYDLFGLHGLRHEAAYMAWNRLRSLDDLRRYYYDVRRMTRLNMGRRSTISTTGPHPGGVNAWGINFDGETYTYDEVTGGTVAVDFASRFHPDVVAHQNFKATVKWVLGLFEVFGNGRYHDDDYYLRYKTVWLPVNGTSIDMSPATSSACRAAFEEEKGRHPFYADEEYGCQFRIFSDNSYSSIVVCDVEFPSDSEFRGWRWEPEKKQEDEK